MKSKEEFKSFVKLHPELIKFVKNGEMTWQKFYELYNLYDDNNEVWNEYFKSSNDNINIRMNNSGANENYNIGDIFNMFKNIKPEVLQQNINSIQKFLGFVQEFVGDSGKIKTPTKKSYTPRPTKRMFED